MASWANSVQPSTSLQKPLVKVYRPDQLIDLDTQEVKPDIVGLDSTCPVGHGIVDWSRPAGWRAGYLGLTALYNLQRRSLIPGRTMPRLGKAASKTIECAITQQTHEISKQLKAEKAKLK